MKVCGGIVAVLACILFGPVGVECQPAGSGYHVIDSLRLGGEDGWDYLTVDTSAERLYVSRGTYVQVVNLTSQSVIGVIPRTMGVHGVALVTSLSKAFTSNGRDSSVTVFNTKTLKTDSTIRIDARNPDAILYDSFSHRVFTFNGGSHNATAIDAASHAIVGTIPLGGKPEFAVSDGSGRIFVNIEDKSEVAMVDPTALKVVKRWSLAPGEEPTGLALDREHRRLFSACSNRLMIISDADAGTVVGKVPIGGGVDGAGYDPFPGLAFSSNGEGTLTVIREEPPDRFSVLDNVATLRGARTMVVDEKSHRIYTVTAKFGAPSGAAANRPHPRPSIEPGSVTLYVIGR